MLLQQTPLVRWAAGLLLSGCGAESAPEGIADLYINEFLASNDTIIANEQGDYVDWIELYNDSDDDLSLSGIYVTDDLNTPLRHALSDITIDSGSYLLLWADQQVTLGDYHLPFSLSASGEAIGLSYLDESGGATLLDGVAFGQQQTDVSWGRSPDGGEWLELTPPTPGTGNGSQ